MTEWMFLFCIWAMIVMAFTCFVLVVYINWINKHD